MGKQDKEGKAVNKGCAVEPATTANDLNTVSRESAENLLEPQSYPPKSQERGLIICVTNLLLEEGCQLGREFILKHFQITLTWGMELPSFT